MILAALIEYDVDGTTSYLGVADGEYTDTTGVSIDLWYPALQSDVSWSEQARHPYQEQGGELSVGDLMIANDGTFDWLMDADIVGMKVTFKRGEAHETFAEMEQVFIARTSGRRFDGHSVIIELDNWLAKLSGPVSTETFDSDTPNPQLVGKQIPYVLGKVTQAPVLEYNPQQLGYYTAFNTSLIGEVTEGGNPTQRWTLEDQPTFNLVGSPILPITSTFEGPSDTGPVDLLAATGSFDSWTGGTPDGWTVEISTAFGTHSATEVATGIEIKAQGTPVSINTAKPEAATSEPTGLSDLSDDWTITSDGGLPELAGADIALTTAQFKDYASFDAKNIYVSNSSVNVGIVFKDAVSTDRPSISHIELQTLSGKRLKVRVNITIPTTGTIVRHAFSRELIASEFGAGLERLARVNLYTEGTSGTISVQSIEAQRVALGGHRVMLSPTVSLTPGAVYKLVVEYASAADPLGVMYGKPEILLPQTFAAFGVLSDFRNPSPNANLNDVSGVFESTFTAQSSDFGLNFFSLETAQRTQTITRVQLIRQSAGNKSYKSLVPHIITQAGYTSAEVDQPSIDAHADKYGDPDLGWLITGQESADQVLFRLAGSLFGYLWHGLDGKVRSKKLEAPGPVADPFVINDANCDPADIVAFDDEAPNLRRSVNALRNWQPINPDRTAGITTTWTEEDRAKVTADWRITRDWEMDTAGKAEFARRWPNVAAREPFSTALRDAITAQLVANQGPDQWIEKPMFFEVPVYVPLGQLSKVAVGETVKAELDYPGLDNEWLLVLGRAGTAQPGMVNLTLWSAGLVPVTLLAPYRFDPRITFTRASVGTYFDSAGVLQTAAVNTPRLDHDPSDNSGKGWLFEEARTNLLLNSNGPVTQDVTVADGKVYTLSVYGAGSAALSGAGTGTATAGSPVTFTASTTKATVTVTGSLDYFQLEAGASASSIIITGATAVTRAADNALIDGVPFSDLWNASEGTIVVEASNTVASSDGDRVYTVSDGTANDEIKLRNPAGAAGYRVVVRDGGVAQFVSSEPASEAAGAIFRNAFTYAENDFRVSLNGGTVESDTSGTIPTVTQWEIAPIKAAIHIANLHYYPKRLTNTQLQAASVVGRDLIREKI